MTPMQRQTTAVESVGAGGSGCSSAAAPAVVTAPVSAAIRASRSRGERPRSTMTVRAGMVVSTPAASRITTALTRPSVIASKRTRSPSTVTTGSASSTPAARSRAAARGVNSPSRSLPGQTGWSSAAPVATTTCSASTCSTRVRRPGDDGRARIDPDDLDAVRSGQRGHARMPPPRRRSRRARAHVARPGRRAVSRPSGVAGSRRSDAVPRASRVAPRPGRSARRRCRPRSRGSCRNRRPGTGCRRDRALRPRARSHGDRVALSSLDRPTVDDDLTLNHPLPSEIPLGPFDPRHRWAQAGCQQATRARTGRHPAHRRYLSHDPGLGNPGRTVPAESWVRCGHDGPDRPGHARIRSPCGSKSGSGWSRAGRRRPMISTSNPEPPGPSGVDNSAGT